jgi:hypothetical protein
VHYHKLGASRCYQQNPNQLMLWKNGLWSKSAMGTKATTTTTTTTHFFYYWGIDKWAPRRGHILKMGRRQEERKNLLPWEKEEVQVHTCSSLEATPVAQIALLPIPSLLMKLPYFFARCEVSSELQWGYHRCNSPHSPQKKPQCATTPHRERDRCLTTTRERAWRQIANASNLVSKQVENLGEGM